MYVHFMAYTPTDASDQPVRIPQSAHQPVPSVPAGANSIPSRITPTQQDLLLARPSVSTGPSCSTEGAQRDKGAENASVISIQDRKVRVTSDYDSMSLYALCRRWVRNDVPRKDQPGSQNFVKILPKPSPAVKVEQDDVAYEEDGKKDGSDTGTSSELQAFLEGRVTSLSEQDLLQSHIKHFKDVRKRSREEQMQRIGRYRQRLALLLHPSLHQNKGDPLHFQ